jgi:hypothetical protein
VYVVRHRHAHAWVEILASRGRFAVPRRVFPVWEYSFDWLTLDPTPSAPSASSSGAALTNVWQDVQQFCVQSWRALIVDYNGDEQADLWDALQSSRSMPRLLKWGLVALGFGLVFVAWRFRRRLRIRRRTDAAGALDGDAAGIYPRLVRTLGKYVSLRPDIGQTPREYGECARELLQAKPALTALAEWPMYVIELFYSVRFGGRPLREEERQELDRGFERFVAELHRFSRASQGRPTTFLPPHSGKS